MLHGEVKFLENAMPTSQEFVNRLASIVTGVSHVEKRGRNEHHKYDYVTESDMVEALRKHLAGNGIVSVPSVQSVQLDKTEKGVMATLTIDYTFTDGKDSVLVRSVGSGYDIPGDKAVYKAMTGAQKYALKQLFLIPTGDDPERDSEDRQDSGGAAPVRHEPKSAPRTTSAPAKNPAGAGADVVKFGKQKGKKLSELEEIDLVWWTKVCEESVAKNDTKWHKKNVEALEACTAEWARRQPWREIWSVCLAIGENHGLDEDGVKVVLKEQLGIASADKLTEADVSRFQAAVSE